jgi:hypothetical protein
MEHTAYLRRQAEFCLNLSRFSSDRPLTERLRNMAAEFHARALKAEFEAEFGRTRAEAPLDAANSSTH